MSTDELFQPIELGNLTLRNRLVMSSHGPNLPDGRYLRYLEERLKTELGLLVCGRPASNATMSFSVSPAGPVPESMWRDSDMPQPNGGTPEGDRFFDETTLAGIHKQAELAHRYGTHCFAQLLHTGSYVRSPDMEAGLSASGLPDEMLGFPTHALTRHEIGQMVLAYGAAAARARRGGLDGIEVHACHGLLLNSFLSPLTNLRTDAYGGSLVNRMRFLMEVIDEIRHRLGADVPIGVRLPGDEFAAGGLTPRDVAEIVTLLDGKIQFVSIAAGSESGRLHGMTVPSVMSSDFGEAVFADASAAVKHVAKVPVILTGRIVDPLHAAALIREGKADLVGMVRALIADPEWVSKARRGEVDRIRPCTGGNEGCRQRTQFRVPSGAMAIGCMVNPAVGREEAMEIVPAAETRSVLVVGGGPAGMEAARVAAMRGHRVVLCDAAASLGGQLNLAIREIRTEGLRSYLDFAMRTIEASGVDIRLGQQVDENFVEALDPQVVVVATGARPAPTPAAQPGTPKVLDLPGVLHASDVGGSVCVVGGLDGFNTPINIAEMLADSGARIHLLTERNIIGENQDPGTNFYAQKRLAEKKVQVYPLTGFSRLTERGVIVFNALTREETALVGIDAVVFADRRTVVDDLYVALSDAKGRLVLPAGDCIAPRRLMHATMEGYRAGMAA